MTVSPLQRWVGSAALAGARVPDRVALLMRGALNGLWLGLLNDEGLRALDECHYSQEAMYRTEEWNDKGLFDWERDAIERHFPAGGRIVVTACGGGRELLALVAAGFDAVGYEPHPALVEYAQRLLGARGLPARAHACARDEFPSGASGDGVVVGWGGYSLLHGRERRIAFLADAGRSVPARGPVLLSFFERGAHGRELRLTRSAANALRRLTGGSEVELGDTLAPNRVHVFTREQIADEVAAAGLELVGYGVTGPANDITNYAAAVARAA